MCKSWAYPPIQTPSFFWLFGLVWEKPSGKKKNGENRFLFPSHMELFPPTPKSGLAQKRPYVDAERGVIYSPLLPWKNLGLTGFGNQDRAKIGAALSWGSAQPWNTGVALPSTPP